MHFAENLLKNIKNYEEAVNSKRKNMYVITKMVNLLLDLVEQTL